MFPTGSALLDITPPADGARDVEFDVEAVLMRDALEPTEDPGWILSHEGYNILTESGVESRFADRDPV
jgi:hypothetical protein